MDGEHKKRLPSSRSAGAFLERVRRGREFEKWERSHWTDKEHKGTEFEAPVQCKGKRGRIDIRLDSGEGYSVVVEIKATDWDKMLPHRVRPNALRHARQIWRYIEAELLEQDAQPALIYPTAPKTLGRREEVETALNERGIQVVWRA